MKRITMWALVVSAVLFLTVLAIGIYGVVLGDAEITLSKSAKFIDATTVTRGEYLVRAGNCIGCHTAKGGAALAGGRILQSEFGEFVTPNITPDMKTGIGSWSADDFWQALHNGKGKGGRLLYPAFPFVNYTQVTREDADAMYAFLKSRDAVVQENQSHRLHFPYDQRVLLALWRAFFFKPEVFTPDMKQTGAWNRGAYLVRGLGHCSACHSSRNVFGANQGNQDLSGGEMPLIHWYAPSLQSKSEASVQSWQASDVQSLLSTGIASKATTFGPMSEVIVNSLQYLSDTDIQSMQVYLQALPQGKAVSEDALDSLLKTSAGINRDEMAGWIRQGSNLYMTHCASCHANDGEGVPLIYPALKGNQALLMPQSGNTIRIILAGGFAPATLKNPRPYSMPPLSPTLSDAEVALILTYVRNAWGNHASPITTAEVNQYRTAPLD